MAHSPAIMKTLRSLQPFVLVFLVAIFSGLVYVQPARAQASATPAADTSFGSAIVDYFANWFPRVTQIQSEQPHWITPLITVTPRLEEEFRYDQYWEGLSHGRATDVYGAGKGIELIPWEDVEIILGIPAWNARTPEEKPDTDGWADETFLIKYRIASANEENGNYIVTAFMGFSAPTGDDGNSNRHGIFTPTLAAGKGFGDFDVQSTLGVAFSDGGLDRLGVPVTWNTTFQYRLFKYFWPEFETNYTWQSYGADTGHSTLYLTPGILVGRIPIHERVGLTFGVGEQVAVTYHEKYNHNLILTARIPF